MGNKRTAVDDVTDSIPNGLDRKKKIRCTEDASTSIFKADTFTFLIGPNEIHYTVHQAAIKELSEPLKAMMTNGCMLESLEGTAYLEDVDPIVFEEFLAYAYNGMYGLRAGIQKYTDTDLKRPIFNWHYCGIAPIKSDSVSHYPFCTPDCQISAQDQYQRYVGRSCPGLHCVFPNCHNKFKKRIPSADTRIILCDNHNLFEVRRDFCDHTDDNLVTLASKSLQLSFEHRKYRSAELSHSQLRSVFELLGPSSRVVPDISFHAQLYVLADRYMINDLKDIALHKLHNNLVATKPDAMHIAQITDLIDYVFDNTNDIGNPFWGLDHIDKLRNLVLAYVVEYSEELVTFCNFDVMLSLEVVTYPTFSTHLLRLQRGLTEHWLYLDTSSTYRD